MIINRIACMIRFGNAWASQWVPEGVMEGDLSVLQGYLAGAEMTDEELSSLIADRPVRPWNILAITFTNKAAKELKGRLETHAGGRKRGTCAASTFHSCLRADSAAGY